LGASIGAALGVGPGGSDALSMIGGAGGFTSSSIVGDGDGDGDGDGGLSIGSIDERRFRMIGRDRSNTGGSLLPVEAGFGVDTDGEGVGEGGESGSGRGVATGFSGEHVDEKFGRSIRGGQQALHGSTDLQARGSGRALQSDESMESLSSFANRGPESTGAGARGFGLGASE